MGETVSMPTEVWEDLVRAGDELFRAVQAVEVSLPHQIGEAVARATAARDSYRRAVLAAGRQAR